MFLDLQPPSSQGDSTPGARPSGQPPWLPALKAAAGAKTRRHLKTPRFGRFRRFGEAAKQRSSEGAKAQREWNKSTCLEQLREPHHLPNEISVLLRNMCSVFLSLECKHFCLKIARLLRLRFPIIVSRPSCPCLRPVLGDASVACSLSCNWLHPPAGTAVDRPAFCNLRMLHFLVPSCLSRQYKHMLAI